MEILQITSPFSISIIFISKQSIAQLVKFIVVEHIHPDISPQLSTDAHIIKDLLNKSTVLFF
jgi:hypothetical protein